MGAHPMTVKRGTGGVYFAVWAPFAGCVSALWVISNLWDGPQASDEKARRVRDFEIFIPGVKKARFINMKLSLKTEILRSKPIPMPIMPNSGRIRHRLSGI